MAKTYINIRYKNNIETIDDIDPADYKTLAEFKSAKRDLLQNSQSAYSRHAGYQVYASSRPTKEWES